MYQSLIEELNKKEVTLVAVSKTKPIEKIMELYDQGQRIFGENRVQELVEKASNMPEDIKWHQIGSLQKNKVKYIAPFISLIHSVDSLSLLKMIQKEAIKNDRTIDVLLQLRIATEETKQGASPEEVIRWHEEGQLQEYDRVKICGLMGMASFTDDQEQVRDEFLVLKRTFDTLKEAYYLTDDNFNIRSMGMSGDYNLAVECGSNMVRIGSLLFGAR